MIVVYFLRSLVFNIIAYTTVTLLLLSTFFTSRISTKFAFKIAKTYCSFIHFLFAKIIGVKTEIRGAEKVAHLADKPCIVASSHQSIWETMFVFNRFFTHPMYVLKKEIAQMTLVSKLIERHIGIVIDRKKSKQASSAIKESASKIFAQNKQIIIFPEGTRVKPGKSVKWKRGFVKLYEDTNTTIVPVALNSGYFWSKNSFIKYPGKIIVEFLDPIEPGLDPKEVLNKTQAMVKEQSLKLAKEGACKYIIKKYF